jgi:hypothetical protein
MKYEGPPAGTNIRNGAQSYGPVSGTSDAPGKQHRGQHHRHVSKYQELVASKWFISPLASDEMYGHNRKAREQHDGNESRKHSEVVPMTPDREQNLQGNRNREKKAHFLGYGFL